MAEVKQPFVFLADLPELVALAQIASVAPSAMAAAFSDPEHFFKHLTLDELARIKIGTDRIAALSTELARACDVYIAQPGLVS